MLKRLNKSEDPGASRDHQSVEPQWVQDSFYDYHHVSQSIHGRVPALATTIAVVERNGRKLLEPFSYRDHAPNARMNQIAIVTIKMLQLVGLAFEIDPIPYIERHYDKLMERFDRTVGRRLRSDGRAFA